MVRARLLVALGMMAGGSEIAHADRDLCGKDARHRGATVELDLQRADLADTLRLLTDVGHTNLVVGDKVEGKVTLRLKHVPWDAALCTIAAVHHLAVTVEDNIVLVRKAD